MTHNKNINYNKVIDDLVDNYNNTLHSSIDRVPNMLDDRFLDTDAFIRKQEQLDKMRGQYGEKDNVKIMNVN